MAKKARSQHREKQQEKLDASTSLSDLVSEEMLTKLKNAKKDLAAAEETKKEQEKEQRIRERKEREKNKSFEELLEEYGDRGSKY